jgi:hypothetical protein
MSNVRIAVIAALAAGGLVSSAAHALTATTFTYSGPKSGFLMLGPADFAPENNLSDYSMNYNVGIGTSSSSQVCLYAPAQLPQEATIKHIIAVYARPAASDTISVVLRRVSINPLRIDHIANDPPAQPPVSEYSGAVYAALPKFSVIANHLHRYDVKVCLANDARLFHARIDYTYTHAGD